MSLVPSTSGSQGNSQTKRPRDDPGNSKQPQMKQPKLTNWLAAVPTSNSFDALSTREESNDMETDDIIDELEAKTASFDKVQNGKRMRRLLEYVTPGLNGYIGIVTVETYKVLTPPLKHTPENLKLANYLGWCCELFKNSVNTGDDIIDRSQTRCNRACWYRLEDIGLTAINDAFLLDLGKNYLIGKYFRHLDCYPDIVEIFNEISLASYIGQQTDLYCSKDISKLTTENYQHLCMVDCTYAISYMPVALGVTLAGIDPEVLQKAGPVLTQLGYFYLIDNDYMDCFGNSEVNGKIGMDIQEGKFRWLAVVCMELASPEQKDLMRTHYGRDDPESIAAVKQLYIDLNLQQVFKDYTADLHERLMTYIRKNLDGGIQEK
uniref:Polyprenyl synthetase n=2 Tax=Lutzomyia longipalpis TaxID=7200 RepID=A0A1B0CSX3_LUTLO